MHALKWLKLEICWLFTDLVIGKIVLSICGRDDETDIMQMILTCCITLIEPYLLMILETLLVTQYWYEIQTICRNDVGLIWLLPLSRICPRDKPLT